MRRLSAAGCVDSLLAIQALLTVNTSLLVVNNCDILAFSTVIVTCAPSFTQIQAIRCLRALATISVDDPSLITPITTRLRHQVHFLTPDNVSHGLWATTVLALCESDESLCHALINRAVNVASEFDAMQSAITAWAAAASAGSVIDVLTLATNALAAVHDECASSSIIKMLLQTLFLMGEDSGVFSSTDIEAIFKALPANVTTLSRFQIDVADELRAAFSSVAAVQEEVLLQRLRGLHSADALVVFADNTEVVVESDGIFHYLKNLYAGRELRRTGATRIRDILIRRAGYTLVTVPFSVWTEKVAHGCARKYVTDMVNECRGYKMA